MQPTPFQQAVLMYRQTASIANLGGRGSGKSVSLCLDAADRCRTLQQHARPLITREQWSALDQLRDQLYDLCVSIFGTKCSVNKSEGTLTVPATSSIITFTQIADAASYSKHQGKSFCSLYHDEWANYGSQAIQLCDRLRSNLRPPKSIRPHIHLTGNPMGRAHALAMRRFVTKSAPGQPFQETPSDPLSPWWIWFTSSPHLNPHLDLASYERNIRASASGDTTRFNAWWTGAWAPAGGQMFGQLDASRHIVPMEIIDRLAFPLARAGGDWGLSAPAVALLALVSTHQHGPARPGSIFIVDEFDTARSDEELHVGLEYPPTIFADRVMDMLSRNGCDPRRVPFVCDDARSLTGSDTVVGLLQEAGLDAYKPLSKDRPGTWALVNQLLSNAKTGEGPGLFFSPRCRHLIETLEEAPRDELRPEDISAKWNRDHWCDALGYLLRDLLVTGGSSSQGRVVGMF